LATPAENLALDEALLDMCEAGIAGPILRFWVPETVFVVVGYGNKVATEVNFAKCELRQVPVLRRCTGGGTVLQASGCLNYALVLPLDYDPQVCSISATNGFVMERNRQALQTVTGAPVAMEGHTDLAIGGRKFCGNAQRRRRKSLLFHGCFLLHCDLAAMEELLLMPSKRPDYRRDRPHMEFVRNLELQADIVAAALKSAWGAQGMLERVPLREVQLLVQNKYSTPEWNLKF